MEQREDLAILCHRHTTSKLKSFDDLKTIDTYGFRGEALASISHIAHLTVTTKTRESTCAWRATYAACELTPAKPGGVAEPKPVAGRQGTQITVEDLFFNMPTRRRAFRSASEEYNKILDVVGKYAIHCGGVAFSCKKHGESSTGLSTQANASIVDCIRQIYGAPVANEIIGFSCADASYGFKASGYATNANYHVKRTTLLIFINHRLVESSNIKRAIEATYSPFLPKGGRPFVYLDLEIEPQRVDVNVHPTKREVNFLHEDEIMDLLCNDIRTQLANVDTSRTFMTQSLLPGARAPLALASNLVSTMSNTTVPVKTPTKPYENNLVRTDAKARKITTMLPPSLPTDDTLASIPDPEYIYTDKEPTLCRLLTIKELRASVRDDMHSTLTETFATHVFVGIIDERRRLAAIQGGVKLFLVDYGLVAAEYFYQVGLTDFGNFGRIKFEPPLLLADILRIAAEFEDSRASTENKFDVDEVLAKVAEQLIERREMLAEYFALDISSEGELCSIPLLMKGYTPSMAKLPRFLLRLGPKVDWASEKGCFDTFLRELAEFYVPEQLPPSPGSGAEGTSKGKETESEGLQEEEVDEEFVQRRDVIRRVVEERLFPAFAQRLVATRGLMKRGAVLEVANLKGLYRVFERC